MSRLTLASPPGFARRIGLMQALWSTAILVAASGLLATGCGLCALRPATPAAQLDSATLDQATPGERYYVMVFASQSVPRMPALTHTWATVIRAVESPGKIPVLEVHTISWLPVRLNIHPLRLTIEPGTNLGLHQTMVYAVARHERISMWGPYECRPSFFRRFLVQKQFLETGLVGYQCDDNWGEAACTGRGYCCIHAVSDLDPEPGCRHHVHLLCGDLASAHIVKRFLDRGYLLQPEMEHDWLIDAVGLKAYRIRRQVAPGSAFSAHHL